MTAADDRYDDLIRNIGVPAAKEAWDDVVKSGDLDGLDSRAVMLTAGLTAIHGDGLYRRLAIEEFVDPLRISDNDVLILRMETDATEADIDAWLTISNRLARRMKDVGSEVTIVLVTEAGALEVIPEETMVGAGWMSARRLAQAVQGDWPARIDDAVTSGDAKKAAAVLAEYQEAVQAFVSGLVVRDAVDREAQLLEAARFYFGGVNNAAQLVTFLMHADEEDFLQWRDHSAKHVLEQLEGGAVRYQPLIDPNYQPPEDADAEGD